MKQQANMQKVRQRIKMMSVNQMTVYHYLLEGFNVMRNTSSEKIQMKWKDNNEKKYPLRNIVNNDVKVPMRPKSKCMSFSYNGAKLMNMLPNYIRETLSPSNFKTLTKEWVWNNIPSY